MLDDFFGDSWWFLLNVGSLTQYVTLNLDLLQLIDGY